MNKIEGLYNNLKDKISANKGLIFTILAATCEIAAVVVTAKQAPKAEKVLIPANKKIATLREEMKDTDAVTNHLVYPEEHKKEIRKIQRKTLLELSKIYALPIIFTGLSLTFMGTSYKTMKDTELALGAAYVTLDKAFKSYRTRVQDKLGTEEENNIFRDIREITKTETIVDPDTGEIKEITKNIKQANGGVWQVLYDAASYSWSKNGRTNYETLMECQKQANVTLKIQQHLFLIDVLKMLEIPLGTIDKDILAAATQIGWIYDPYDDNRSSWVSFGISDELGNPNEIGLQLFNYEERDVMLSFNCDGVITNDFVWHLGD